jgi:hypothetical protein
MYQRERFPVDHGRWAGGTPCCTPVRLASRKGTSHDRYDLSRLCGEWRAAAPNLDGKIASGPGHCNVPASAPPIVFFSRARRFSRRQHFSQRDDDDAPVCHRFQDGCRMYCVVRRSDQKLLNVETGCRSEREGGTRIPARGRRSYPVRVELAPRRGTFWPAGWLCSAHRPPASTRGRRRRSPSVPLPCPSYDACKDLSPVAVQSPSAVRISSAGWMDRRRSRTSAQRTFPDSQLHSRSRRGSPRSHPHAVASTE